MATRCLQLRVVAAACPELAPLLQGLGDRLAPGQLVLKESWRERQEAVAMCKRQRHKYLENMALLSAIESMIEDFCSMEDEASEDTGKLAKLMHNGGLWSEPAVYKGMDKALTMAKTSQQLLLPEFPDASLGPLPPDTSLGGPCSTIMGLKPEDVLAHAATLSPASLDAIPELEHRLAQECRWLGATLLQRNSGQQEQGGGQERSGRPAAGRALAEVVAERVVSLEDSRAAGLEQQAANSELVKACAAQLTELLEILSELMNSHKFGSRFQKLEVEAKYLQTHCRTLLQKLETLKAQIMSKTYTPDNVQALNTASDHIDTRHQEVKSQLIQVQKKLAEYQEHEAELRPLAREHAELKAKLRDAEFTLEQLQAVDQENRGCEEQTSLGRKRVILGAYDM